MEHAEMAHRCFRCGYCKFTRDYQEFNCPSYRKSGFDTFAPGGRMWLINAWLNGKVSTSDRYSEILYSCATCGNCKERCVYTFKDDILDLFQAAKTDLVDGGRIPPPVRDYFKAIDGTGNPFRLPQAERGSWAEGAGVPSFAGQEYLFYVGCVGSYDEVGKKMARSVAALLLRAGVSLGILGAEETADGNEVRVLGEAGLFRKLAERNIRTFSENGVKRIITLDPHAFHSFTAEYPKLGGTYEVRHFTQVLDDLVRDGRLRLSGYEARVTYHDPCYLGRHNRLYDPPRSVLRAVPGVELVEMRRNKADAFCCGGGGGNFFTDMIGLGEEAPSKVRVREAAETGAEVLAVSCPACAKMLGDAVKSEDLEDKLRVADVAEVVTRALAHVPPVAK